MVSINDKKEEKSVSEKIGAVIMKFRFLFLSVIGILIVAAIAAGIAITVSESSRKKGLETLDSLMYPLTQAVQEEYPAARDAALPEILALAEKNANNVVGVRAYMAAAELYFDMEDWASARDAWVAAAGAGTGAYTAAVCYYNAEKDKYILVDGFHRYRVLKRCPTCQGTRLTEAARHVFIGEGEQKKAIYEISAMSLEQAKDYFLHLQVNGARSEVARKLIDGISQRLQFLNDVGLGYLCLDRRADTLSGGEAQRIRLASQIGSGLTGVMYVLDEPSIGLHQCDNDKLIETMKRLRDLGNSVIVVEHDEDTIRAADFVVDMGPGAGELGGRVVAAGTPIEIEESDSLTGLYLSGKKTIEIEKKRRKPEHFLRIIGAHGHNLKNVTLEIPQGLVTVVTGVSGSGKSTLINDTLYRIAAKAFYRASAEPQPYQSIEGLELFDKVVNVDQSPIGRSPRSNPATYTGLFAPIREIFAQTPTARERGYDAGRFSFNVRGGRCEACQGDGFIRVEMNFLPDMYVPCEVCHGKRYNRETLEVLYKGLNIAQVLDLTVDEAAQFFSAHPVITRKLQTLHDVGLGYIRLGQSALTLSGGEAQRMKLALELSKKDTTRTLYILDEPTTGLYFEDVQMLIRVIGKLRDAGNTVVIIEHNLDVIASADWIIDLGPQGGEAGGEIVATGTPAQIAKNKVSVTGQYLKRHLKGRSK